MKKMNCYKTFSLGVLLGIASLINSCAPGGQGSVNLFSVEQDIQFGKQLRDEIANNPKEYPLLDPVKYARAYQILQNITNKILNSGGIEHRNDFEWKLHIIHDDKTLNAFVSPGGYIYVYTGLIKYLDKEDELAGVMGHEIAHADRRHSTTNMTKQYGLQVVLGAAMGQNPGMMKQILGGLTGKLVGLKFGRAAESDADAMSVQYLAKTDYNCAGTAGFFEKMMAQGGQQQPQWLSTHPSHENRVNDIYAKSKELGCKTTPLANQASYQELKRSLP
jgi:beta-barrel assembly-enhancing protease